MSRLVLLLLGTLGLASCATTPEISKNVPPTLAGYKKVFEDRLGALWYKGVEADPDITVGTVKFAFKIPAAGGSVFDLKLISNTAGVVDARIARVAIRSLRAPPVPAAILAADHADHLDMDESFTVFQDGRNFRGLTIAPAVVGASLGACRTESCGSLPSSLFA